MHVQQAQRQGRCIGWNIIFFAAAAVPIGSKVVASGAIAQPLERVVLAAGTPNYGTFVAEAAHRFDLPEAWIRAVIAVESRGDPDAVSPAGAMGLMQLMPETWRFERARLALGDDPFDARDNILAGSDYLRMLRDRYGALGMLAAYNAGPGRYDDYRRGARPLPAETLAYVQRLAPVLTGDTARLASISAPVDPLAWRRAPLFAARRVQRPVKAFVSDNASTARSDSSGRSAFAADRLRTDDEEAANDRAVDSVFVRLSGGRS